jgi:hypothetical protein
MNLNALSIQDWVNELARVPVKDFTVPRVQEFVRNNAIGPETLAYLFYAESHYTRNLIHKCDLFEVLSICWNVGHYSRPHASCEVYDVGRGGYSVRELHYFSKHGRACGQEHRV